MTYRQALFLKYLATRFDYNWFISKEPKNIFDEVVPKNKGETLRNIAMYFYSRYPNELKTGWKRHLVYRLKGRWWEANFLTSQIDGCILLDKARDILNDYVPIKNTNW